MSPTRACCFVVAFAVAGVATAACSGVEERSGVVVEGTFGDPLLSESPTGIAFEVELDSGVRNYSVIRVGAPYEEISCASGTEFTPALMVEGISVEFEVDTRQDFDTSDPPGFGVRNLVVDC